MQTIDEAREHCRFVGKGIEKMVADGEDLTAKFEGASWAANNVCRWTNEFLKGIATMKKTVMMVATCLMAAITFAEDEKGSPMRTIVNRPSRSDSADLGSK